MDIRTEFQNAAASARAVRDEIDEMETSHVSVVTPLITGLIAGTIGGVLLRGALRLAFGRE